MDAFDTISLKSQSGRLSETPDKIYELIKKNEIGAELTFLGPFGQRKVIYCDYASNGRALGFIEDFISSHVLPKYGNTHTTSTTTASQTTHLREEARDIIREAVNAGKDDCVIFSGSGPTCALNKIITGLSMDSPPVVFVSRVDHHFKVLPWLEISSEVVYINQSNEGGIDLSDLKKKLAHYNSHDKFKSVTKIGCFSVASSITGILVDVNKITLTLHKSGALAVWDYNCAAPFVRIDMNPELESNDNLYYKDAIYFSTHRFIGGPQTTEVLVAKKHMFKNKIPNGLGGGTVLWVTRKEHGFIKHIEEREEGGTPSIIQNIRTGLVLQLKSTLTESEAILPREFAISKHVLDFLGTIPNLHVLGNADSKRFSIFSFLIRIDKAELYLHPRLVAQLLHDLFGIQARVLSAFASPYAASLMGITSSYRKSFAEATKDLNVKLLEPCFNRLSLPYFTSAKELDFVLEAVRFVSLHGYKFLALYNFDMESAEWHHQSFHTCVEPSMFSAIDYLDNSFNYKPDATSASQAAPSSFQECFRIASDSVASLENEAKAIEEGKILNAEANKYRWFLLPSEASVLLRRRGQVDFPVKSFAVFKPASRILLPQ